jgi:peroxiredoxin
MHRKLKDRGLVVVAVSVDDPVEKEAEEEARKFLRQQKASFANFLLDEEAEVWQRKLQVESIPCAFVFNRAGQVEKKYLDSPDHAELEKLVEQLLRRK